MLSLSSICYSYLHLYVIDTLSTLRHTFPIATLSLLVRRSSPAMSKYVTSTFNSQTYVNIRKTGRYYLHTKSITYSTSTLKIYIIIHTAKRHHLHTSPSYIYNSGFISDSLYHYTDRQAASFQPHL